MPFHTTMAPYNIIPVSTPDTAQIWEGAKQGKLMVQKCTACGFLNWPPSIWCGKCKDPDAAKEFVEVSGKGTLYCWYICHDTSITGYEDKVPYAVILTELDEQPGLILMSNILNFEYGVLGEGLQNGMALKVVFDHDDGSGLDVIQFEPAS